MCGLPPSLAGGCPKYQSMPAMFFQLPEQEPANSGFSSGSINNTPSTSTSLKSARRKRKKRAQKYKVKKLALKKEKLRFANTMSSWASNFTMAATWQLKHELAYWKSKARTLQYENKVLCDILRQYHANGKSQNNESQRNYDNEAMSVKSDTEEDVEDENEAEEDETEDDETEEGVEIEISEEFIQFLKGNTEFRKMRLERERLRQLEEEMPMRKLEACPDTPTDNKEEYKKLYGSKWQRISALEMHMQSQFMADCDKEKPLVWPNVPLRL